MLPIGLNHMTVPRLSARVVLDLAVSLGCAGVELRNDLGKPLFDGADAAEFGASARQAGLRIFALAEVKAFNANPNDNRDAATALIKTAVACGAEGVALIPMVSDKSIPRAEQREALRQALEVLMPILTDYEMVGLIEPLGFFQSSLRHKDDVVAVLDAINRPACFAMIHDTFHHHLAGDTMIYPDMTAILHISGVTDPQPNTNQMTDAYRVLVDGDDRLGNIAQLRSFQAAGFKGPVSFEAFAPAIHDMTDPATALAGSIAFITSQLTETSAGAMG
ncbi:MAG: 2-keto-myo-inositol isomerase [Yoonia sp.]|jgi:2-keto-myo-inositol isomerase